MKYENPVLAVLGISLLLAALVSLLLESFLVSAGLFGLQILCVSLARSYDVAPVG